VGWGEGWGRGSPFNGRYGEAAPKGVPFSGFRNIRISQVEVYKKSTAEPPFNEPLFNVSAEVIVKCME